MKQPQQLIPLPQGWEADSYYVVEVAVHRNNPIHACVMSVGSVDEFGNPVGIFNYVFNLTHDPEVSPIHKYAYIRAVRKIDMVIPNNRKTLAYNEISATV
jgi:hypothetical protein